MNADPPRAPWSWTVRLARQGAEELDVLCGLWRELVAELRASRLESNAVPVETMEPTWRLRAECQIAAELIAVLETAAPGEAPRLSGYLSALTADTTPWVPPDAMFVVELYVTPARRRGFPSYALFKLLRQTAKRLGKTRWLATTHRDHRALRLMLQTCNFVPTPGLCGIAPPDNVWWTRPIE